MPCVCVATTIHMTLLNSQKISKSSSLVLYNLWMEGEHFITVFLSEGVIKFVFMWPPAALILRLHSPSIKSTATFHVVSLIQISD